MQNKINTSSDITRISTLQTTQN